jgi:hypothetical protein
MAVATALRSIIGCILPLFSDALFRRLGWGVGGTLLAAIAIPAIPAPLIMVRRVVARFPTRPTASCLLMYWGFCPHTVVLWPKASRALRVQALSVEKRKRGHVIIVINIFGTKRQRQKENVEAYKTT